MDEWDRAEAIWWAEVKVRGFLAAYCEAACDAMNELDAAVDELMAARAKAEAALEKVQAATGQAEEFSKLVARVLDRPDAIIEAAANLDALKPPRRRKR